MSKTLGATRDVFMEALESNETTFARQKKRYWRELLTESVSVLDIGMSALIDSDFNENSETTRTPLSGTSMYNNPLYADSIGDPASSHVGYDPFDIRGVARKHRRVRAAPIAPH